MENKVNKFIPHSGFKYPNVLLMGYSGVGKSRSICGLDPKKTIVVVTEKSTIAIPKVKEFYENNTIKECRDFRRIIQGIKHYSMDENIETIVIDSFTGLWRGALKVAQTENKGFAVWDTFAQLIQEFLDLISDIRQIVIVIAHAEKEVVSEFDTDYEIDVVIDGKRLKKLPISSQFEITLFAKKEYIDDLNVNYQFYTNALKNTQAKSPEGMFDRIIDNDLGIVVKGIKDYFGDSK